jgi:hypothetical protein
VNRWSLRTVLTGSAVALVTLVAGEFALRLALPDFDPTMQLRFELPRDGRPTLGPADETFRLAKNSGDYNVAVRFNRYGLRDSQDVAEARPDDLLLLGDSFAFGWGVEERDRVSEQLSGLIGRRVFNLGAPGDLRDYAMLLDYARQLGARAENVVIAFNMSNDILDYDASAPTVADEDAARPSRLQHVKGVLLENSALYFTTTAIVNRWPVVRDAAVRMGLVVPLSAVPSRTVNDAAIASTVRRLAAVAQHCRMTILIIPSRGLWIGEHVVEERAIHDRFVAVLLSAGLPFADMRPLQERGGDPMRYHFVNDGHWRPQGHELAAQALAHMFKARS